MARVEKKEVTQVVTTEVVVTLSMEEAQALTALLGTCKAGGVTSVLWNALRSNGISGSKHKIDISNGNSIVVTKREGNGW